MGYEATPAAGFDARSGPLRCAASTRLLLAILALWALASCDRFDGTMSGYREGYAAFKIGDHDRAFEMWLSAAEQGNARAQKSLGDMYAYGLGTEPSDTSALAWYRKSAEQEFAPGLYALATLLEAGRGGQAEPAELVELYQQAARLGHGEAESRVGALYENGKWVEQDDALAAKWYQRAALQNDPRGLAGLALLTGKGRGVALDVGKSIELNRKAADLGSARAQHNLSVAYETGVGVKPDDAESARWLKLAAEQGMVESQYALGLTYSAGVGVARDLEQSARWYRAAAEQGYAEAQAALGIMYALGEGVPEDEFTAYQWFSKAAAQGNGLAQAQLELRGPPALRAADRTQHRDDRAAKSGPASDAPGICKLATSTLLVSRADCLTKGGQFAKSNGGGLIVVADRYQREWLGSATKRRQPGTGGGAANQGRQASSGLTDAEMKEVEKQLGYKPITRMPPRAQIGGAGSGGGGRGSSQSSGSGDVIVCYSTIKEHELIGTKRRGGSPAGQRMRCSRVLADPGGHTESFCRDRGFQGYEFFKFADAAREWINDNCWTAWRTDNYE